VRPLPPGREGSPNSRQNVVMTVYWISVYEEITDEAKLAAYAKLATPALEGAGGTFVARSLLERTYEAGERTRTVVIEVDSVEAARSAHESPAYQEALAALDGGAVRDVRIVPGV
jgi:uncharacterized protein (DUF1330 family)